ncbi:hypothetical protein [Cryptosporangium minutisporangium]|uniref:Uncharacterized protein n=1 Tax=Cryptosporangium minutisporangium TaxID=113569 RepID=A0ABP6SXA1_9ACTN
MTHHDGPGPAFWVDMVIDGRLHTVHITARSAEDAARRPHRDLHLGAPVTYRVRGGTELLVHWLNVAALEVRTVSHVRPSRG